MPPNARVELDDSFHARLVTLLDAANGNRRARRLTVAELEAVLQTALSEPVGYAWKSAGDSPDPRSLTAVCLAVRLDDVVVVSASSARGAATPASAWHDIPSWNVVNAGANTRHVRAWARRREQPDRLHVPIVRDAPETTEESLRAEILANPDDDAPRHVLSDLLIERGDPRGEFIALQLQLEAAPDEAVSTRAKELLNAHGDGWVGLSRDEALPTFRRGFVESLQIFEPLVSTAVAELCGREPVRALRFVTSRRMEMHSLSLAPWLPRIHTLEFVANNRYGLAGVTADALEALLETSSIRGLKRLVLRDQPVGDHGAAMFAQYASSLPSLRALVLQNAALTARGARTLSGIRWFNRLEELSLADNAFQVQGVEALVGNGAGRSWKTLDLSGTAMGNAGAFVIARARAMTSLSSLFVARNRNGPNGLAAILDAPHLASLTEVDFAGNPIAAAGREKLAARFGPAPHRLDDR
ncbi:MAG: hypothetical protein DI536_12150 [Archangium gephyra]|uniref:TIGR02996 domain-containing protein n=1 Tax=Archangium gephyra TaxID=48 RepID=A0A2W5TQ48_9BACT|nr:MAG: hypothetical protein DI536_12150 [Archangium gephyra]